MMRKAKIAGTGMCVPERVVTNFDLEKLMDTSNDWIVQRSGIKERRHIDGDTGPADLALTAAQKALKAAGCEASDLDFVMVATLSADHVFPGTAAFLQAKLGLDTTPSMDVRCQCSGFVYGLATAKAFVESGQYKRILVVGAEVQSPVLDFSTRGRDVAVLFGDGAGAAVVEAVTSPDDSSEIMSTVLHSQGEHAEKLWLEKPGTAGETWMTEDRQDPRNFPYMDGRFVFRNAVVRLEQVVKNVAAKADVSVGDIDHFLFHQANLRINEFVAKSMEIPPAKIHSNIEKYGNCSGASIPMLLAETVAQDKIKRGDLVCMAAFGAGFTWAAAIARW